MTIWALQRVALYDPDEALVGVGVNEYLQVHQLAQLLLPQRHDTLDDDYLARLHVYGLLQAVAHQVAVGGLLDGFPLPEFLDMLGQQIPVKGIRVVEVNLSAVLHSEVRVVIIVGVLWDDRHTSRRESLDDLSYYRGLARPCSACYTYYIHVACIC